MWTFSHFIYLRYLTKTPISLTYLIASQKLFKSKINLNHVVFDLRNEFHANWMFFFQNFFGQFWPILPPSPLDSILVKIDPNSLILYEITEKISHMTICRPHRFQVMRCTLTMTPNYNRLWFCLENFPSNKQYKPTDEQVKNENWINCYNFFVVLIKLLLN